MAREKYALPSALLSSPFVLGRIVTEGATYTDPSQVCHIFPSWPELTVSFCLCSTDLICGALPFGGWKNLVPLPGEVELPEQFLDIHSAVLFYQGSLACLIGLSLGVSGSRLMKDQH